VDVSRRATRPYASGLLLPSPLAAPPAGAPRGQAIKRGKSSKRHSNGAFTTTRGHPSYRHRGRHLLTGFLRCGLGCGSFFDVHGTGFLGCGWSRDRGPKACVSALRVSAADLEDRVLSAIRDQVLIPDVVAYAVQSALMEIRQTLCRDDPDKLRERLAQICAARERLLDAIEDGSVDMDNVKRPSSACGARRRSCGGRSQELEAEPLDAESFAPRSSRGCARCGLPLRVHPRNAGLLSKPSWETTGCGPYPTLSESSESRDSFG